jgi:glycosyltransferase involved in cell wall biosynthesis
MANDPGMELSVVILTYNEEVNIGVTLDSVIHWADHVLILDSESTDRTVEIAREKGAEVYFRKFDNYAAQRNFAIRELPLKTEWMLFLDADEQLTEELKKEIADMLRNPVSKNGFYMKRRVYFLDKWIRFGGYYPTWLLRLFRKDHAVVDREMNEHVVVDGSVGFLKYDFIDNNRKGISDWIAKHNRYSTFEALELLKYKENREDKLSRFWGSQAERKRWIRYRIWNPLMPPLIRPFIYFFYRYFLRLGFLDGIRGFIFHFLHGLWYILLIDIKYLEMKWNRSRHE